MVQEIIMNFGSQINKLNRIGNERWKLVFRKKVIIEKLNE